MRSQSIRLNYLKKNIIIYLDMIRNFAIFVPHKKGDT